MEANNMKAMREALKLCGSQMCKLCKDLTLARSMINKGLMGVSCHPDKCKPYQAAHAALALPLRQCDVGTAEEQRRRYDEWRNHDGLRAALGKDEFDWAQMPYESEVKK